VDEGPSNLALGMPLYYL